MFSRITLAWLSAVALVVGGAGCRDNNTGTNDMAIRDLGANSGDLAGVDMSVMKTYKDATPNQIDTAPITDVNYGDGINVKLSRMVAVTPVAMFLDRPFCKSEVWVQDPACQTPPCGILLVARGPMLTPLDGSTRDCPSPSAADTILKNVQLGDNVDVYGTVDAYKPTGKMVTQHRLDIDRIDVLTGTRETINPIVVTDPTLFVNNTGGGWNMYEGTLITLDPPAAAELTVQKPFPMNRPTFETTPGPVIWTYTFLFNTQVTVDGGWMLTFPVTGQRFTSITGVVATLFDGQIVPRAQTDFTPQNGL